MTAEVARLFARVVPEISEGVVQIMAIARREGELTKVAVRSYDDAVDPVEAVVGNGGEHTRELVRLLGDAMIDIVPWSDDPVAFVCDALAPTPIAHVIIDHPKRRIELFVPDEALHIPLANDSLHVQLAANLTGWHIDIFPWSRYLKLQPRSG